MRRNAITAVLLLLCVTLLAVAPALAAQEALDWVPEKALGFVAINGLANVDAKCTKVSEAAGVPLPVSLGMIKMGIGFNVGLDEKIPVVLIAMPGGEDGDTPRPILLIPVSDYKAFVGQLNPEKVTDAIVKVQVARSTALVAPKGDYAVMVEESGRELLDAMLAGKQPTRDLGPWKAWIGECDVAAVGSRAALEMALGENDPMEGLWPAIMPGSKSVIGSIMYSRLVPVAKMARDELTDVALGVVVESDGAVRARLRARCKADGKLIESLGSGPAASSLLDRLPKSEFMYAAAGSLPKPPAEDVTSFYESQDYSPENLKRAIEIAQSVEGAAAVFATPKDDQPIDELSTVVFRTTDAEAFVTNYAVLLRAGLKDAKSVAGMPKEDVKVEDTQVDGQKAVTVTTDRSAMYDSIIEGMPEEVQAQMEETFKTMVKKLYGEDGKEVVYVVAADKTHVVMVDGNADRARAAVASVKRSGDGLASAPSLVKIADKLSADAPWIVYADPMGMFKIQMSMSPAAAMALPVELVDSSLGLSIKTASSEIDAQLYVPVDAIKGIGQMWQMFSPLFQMRQADVETELILEPTEK